MNVERAENGQAAEAEERVRINKALAAAGVCSRRAADVLVEKGAVTVNGEVVRLPGTLVDLRKDDLAVHGKPVWTRTERRAGHVYLAMHKPVRVVTTTRDPQGRKTVLDLLPQRFRNRRVFPVGRLDFFSSGLLLLTTDGDLCQRLTHPSHELPKTYRLRVRGHVGEAELAAMRGGMTLAEGERLAPVEVRVLERNGEVEMEMVLRQGINRQIRRMCRDLGLTVLRLARTEQGPIDLGALPQGKVRPLTGQEVAALRAAAGIEEKRARQAARPRRPERAKAS